MPDLSSHLQDALAEAVNLGNHEAIHHLIAAGANPNDCRVGHKGLLEYSTTSSSLKVVKALLDGGADPNAECIGGGTPFHSLVFYLDHAGKMRKKHKEFFVAFLDAGGDPERHDRTRRCPLDNATERLRPVLEAALATWRAGVPKPRPSHKP